MKLKIRNYHNVYFFPFAKPCLSAYPCKHIVQRDKNLLLVAESEPELSALEPALSLHKKTSQM